jgi:hypothetical protein
MHSPKGTHRVKRVRDPTLDDEPVYLLAKNTVLYTGDDQLSSKHMFLTPHKSLARMYANLKPDGKIFKYITNSELLLIHKESTQWALKKGKKQKGEWDGFGADTADFGTAIAFCRQRKSETSWLKDYDGWIYKFSNITLGEVMLCDDSALTLQEIIE